MFVSRSFAALLLAVLSVVIEAHIVITYPGWRGNNLLTNERFPYGMQWIYPCGGIRTTTNRTNWPLNGGAIAVQPGWFQGHATAFFYINIGYGNDGPDGGPPNISFPMVPVFQITGPSKDPFPGTFCLPQVPIPMSNITPKIGDNATIQVIETAIHGASLFSCVDITFSEPEHVNEVNSSNCFNSSDISFNEVYTIALTQSSSANPRYCPTAYFLITIGLLIYTIL